mmetsp:Transcript_33361/g.76122  ORF Transcript_33361/g.76122 Transcript_33361/m.76122 type:complete len:235 (+) Transcript_33361:614-1318(+)
MKSLQAGTRQRVNATLMSCVSERLPNCGDSASAALPKSSVTSCASLQALALEAAKRSFVMSSTSQPGRVAAAALHARGTTVSATAADFVPATTNCTRVSSARPSRTVAGTFFKPSAHALTSSPSPFSPKWETARAITWNGAIWHKGIKPFGPTVPSPFSRITVAADSQISFKVATFCAATRGSTCSPPNLKTCMKNSMYCCKVASFFSSAPGTAASTCCCAVTKALAKFGSALV